MKLSVIYIAMICSMPVIEARCKRSHADTCGSCNTISVQSTNDGLISYRLCDGGGPGVCDPSEGRLEVYYNNQWGSVCDDNWLGGGFSTYPENPNVVCKMFGFSSGFSKPGAYYGQAPGSFPIHLDDVQCIGSESSVADCSHSAWGLNNCLHSDDVGVQCFP